MEARLIRASVVALALLLSIGAPAAAQYSARSQHFIVTAASPQLAQEIAQAAEQYRRDLAIEWLGHELPPWRGLCPITVQLAPGAGGATSFMFDAAGPYGWTMQIQGSRERMLDSVLPHEITHTIFATHFGRPLPRWADEGACTTVEHEAEKAKQDKFLLQFLTSNRGIAFNKMFAMTEYPRDILPLYSQGYSLARYLIQQGGKRKFVDYVGEGMRTNNWTATTRKFYGFDSLSDLQVTWVEWVRQGSPSLEQRPELASNSPASAAPATQMASLTQQPQTRVPDGALASWQTSQSQNARTFARADEQADPVAPSRQPATLESAGKAAGDYSRVSRPVSDGWYAKRRDEAQQVLRSGATVGSSDAPGTGQGNAPQTTSTGQGSGDLPRNSLPAVPSGLDQGMIPAVPTRQPVSAAPASLGKTPDSPQVLLEWSRSPDQPAARTSDLAGVAVDSALLRR